MDLKKKNETSINPSEANVPKKPEQFQNEDKERNKKKTSTIEDLRHVLTSQIEEKDRVIHVYENLIERLKEKIKEKF
jgi:hypothetical protein